MRKLFRSNYANRKMLAIFSILWEFNLVEFRSAEMLPLALLAEYRSIFALSNDR